MLRFELDFEKMAKALETTPELIDLALFSWLREATEFMAAETRLNTPRGKSSHPGPKLYETIETRVSGFSGFVFTNSPIGKLVEDGFGVHAIRPSGKKALKFTVRGKTVFAKVVIHPGYKGSHFMKKTLNQNKAHLKQWAEDTVRSKLKGWF